LGSKPNKEELGMRISNQFLLILVAIAASTSLLLSGCLLSPEEDLGNMEVSAEGNPGTARPASSSTEGTPNQSHALPGTAFQGKADNPHDGSRNPATLPDGSKADESAEEKGSCPLPEDGEVPQDKCPDRGVEHGSPQPLDPADPPQNGDKSEPPSNSDCDDDDDE
jgi:hypothetical protein